MEPGVYYRMQIDAADLTYLIDLLDLMSGVPDLAGDTTGERRQGILSALRQSDLSVGVVMKFGDFLYLDDLLADSIEAQDLRIACALANTLNGSAYMVV